MPIELQDSWLYEVKEIKTFNFIKTHIHKHLAVATFANSEIKLYNL